MKEHVKKKSALKGDLLWAGVLLILVLILILPQTRTEFISITEKYPYISGFFKYFILATMGDWLGTRLIRGQWKIGQGFFYKACIWGMIGMAITLVFTVYTEGTQIAQMSGKLPFWGNSFAQALFSSVIMNLTFGPMLYIYHKFGDLIVDAMYNPRINQITLKQLVDRVDWYSMVSFSWLKTCLFIWIPCHTVVFLLPEEYRVLASAFLSVLLGILVTLSKKNTRRG